jgi:hypothetical protein
MDESEESLARCPVGEKGEHQWGTVRKGSDEGINRHYWQQCTQCGLIKRIRVRYDQSAYKEAFTPR